jgi:RNA polymerase sigma-B factor
MRDKGWNVRVPRRLQELRAEIIAIREPLTQRLGRAPSRAELAEELGITETEVQDTLLAAQAYSATSLQAPAHRGDTATVADLVAHEDKGFDVVDARESLRAVLGGLPERERRILGLRFYRQLSQCEIAAELGISQMHVSRLITRSLGSLREQLQLAG